MKLILRSLLNVISIVVTAFLVVIFLVGDWVQVYGSDVWMRVLWVVLLISLQTFLRVTWKPSPRLERWIGWGKWILVALGGVFLALAGGFGVVVAPFVPGMSAGDRIAFGAVGLLLATPGIRMIAWARSHRGPIVDSGAAPGETKKALSEGPEKVAWIPAKPAPMQRTKLEPPNPEPWLWLGLALDVVAWVVVTFGAPIYDPLRPLGPLLPASTGLAVLLFGAIVYIRVYDYVNRRAEKRELRQEYALSRVKDIYVPLWDETTALIESAGRYEWAEMRYGDEERQEIWKRGFDRMMRGPLRLFVDDRLRELLTAFHSTLPAYNRAWSAARSDLFNQSRIATSEMTGQPAGDSPTSDIANLIMLNDRFVWGAMDLGEDGVRNFRDRFREMYSRAPGMKPDEADSDLDKLVARLRSLNSAETMRQTSRTSVTAGKLAIKRLEEIVRDPTSVVLEFAT